MLKFLTRVGNSEAIVIDKAILSLLHISAATPLEISTDGKNLVISPVSEPDKVREVTKAYRAVKKRFPRALKRLAD
jgi:antitoxin component of MazEF toxin-antitoxin module